MGVYDREYYRDESENSGRLPLPRSAWANLILANVAVFFLCWFTSPDSSASSGPVADLLALRADLFTHPWEFWRLLTYGFAHANLLHILLNMYGLFLFGRDIEDRYGKWEFLRLYLVLIVFSGLVWLVVQAAVYGFTFETERVPTVVGASGAVFGVTILFCLCFPQRVILLMAVIPIPAWLLGTLYVGLGVLGALRASDNVAHEAHLAGALLAFVYYRLQWNLRWLWPGDVSSLWRRLRRPKLTVHRAPPVESEEDAPYDDLDRRGDEVLDKLHRFGEGSLTARERRTLEEYSRRMRQKHR